MSALLKRQETIQKYLHLELFAELHSFRDLEDRIRRLPINEHKIAFNLLVEAYLSTMQPIESSIAIPIELVPTQIKSEINLSEGDDVDGIIENRWGDIFVYKTLFLKNDHPPKKEVLENLGKNIHFQYCISNIEKSDKHNRALKHLNWIDRHDLLSLKTNDFRNIVRYLEKGKIKLHNKKPYPHQKEAVRRIAHGFKENNRLSVYMACGSGKTLVGLWSAEHLKIQRIVVFIPTLGLLRQYLNEWLTETRWPDYSFIAVCSDQTVNQPISDEIIFLSGDLDFTITTKPEEVIQFLTGNDSRIQIIFSTYQSAPVVAEALKPGEVIDLGIFDEAHKTATAGSFFNFALDDHHISIKKRLFFTATPRHYRVREKDNENQLVYSMDNLETYGPVAYHLTFREAVKQNLISDYQVVISVITKKTLHQQLLKESVTKLGDKKFPSLDTAQAVAIQQFAKKFPIKKIFSFHQTIEKAKSFSDMKNHEDYHHYLQSFLSLHISSLMNTNEREKVLKVFGLTDKSILTNVRCLTEGINVPAVDLVAFLSPKHSVIDIVQAAGRCMRKSPNKKIGYILVPVFLEEKKGESIEAALERANFEDAWEIVQAMQEYDEDIRSFIVKIRDKVYGNSEISFSRQDKIQILGPRIHLKTLERSIGIKLIKKLTFYSDDPWLTRYDELVQFKEKYGHCNLPNKKEYRRLRSWCSDQRSLERIGNLKAQRKEKLLQIEFPFDLYQTAWDNLYSQLIDFKKKYGHCNVPGGWTINKHLSGWVVTQRTLKKWGKLNKEREERLMKLGFVFSFRQLPVNGWLIRYQQLIEFKKQYGHCNVPESWSGNKQLGDWVNSQRIKYRKGKLDSSHEQKLREIGFIFNVRTKSGWDHWYNQLRDLFTQVKHYDATEYLKKNKMLARWVRTQRHLKKIKALSKDREDKLSKLGDLFETSSKNQSVSRKKDEKSDWLIRYRQLKNFKKQYGHCNPPNNKEYYTLYYWCSQQRTLKIIGSLGQDREKKLFNLDFSFDSRQIAWDNFYKELIFFKNMNGHCNVPKQWSANKRLAAWVHSQRLLKRSGKLKKDREDKLIKLGFNFKIKNN